MASASPRNPEPSIVNRSWRDRKWGKDWICSPGEAFCAGAPGAGFGGSSTKVDAVTLWPEICAVNPADSRGPVKRARPVASVLSFVPLESSTAAPGTRRPAASSTASVAGSPATILGGRRIARGGPVCGLGGCCAGVAVALAASHAKTTRGRNWLPRKEVPNPIAGILPRRAAVHETGNPALSRS